MASYTLEDFDSHIEHLRAQLQFLSEGLDATDHNAPDWLAADLISLRNRSGRLHDDMKRFRDQLHSEGLAVKRAKTAHKRLSLESAKASTPSSTPQPSNHAVSPPRHQTPTPRANPTQPPNAHEVDHVDITEEVNRRLQESRLRRLLETPSTAHKRKRNGFEEPRSENSAETADDLDLHSGYSGNGYDGTPTKRLKSTGTFEQALKRKETGDAQRVEEEPMAYQSLFKKRKK